MDKVRHVLAVHKRKGGADEPTSGVDVSEAAPPLELLNDDDAASHLVAYMRNLVPRMMSHRVPRGVPRRIRADV